MTVTHNHKCFSVIWGVKWQNVVAAWQQSFEFGTVRWSWCRWKSWDSYIGYEEPLFLSATPICKHLWSVVVCTRQPTCYIKFTAIIFMPFITHFYCFFTSPNNKFENFFSSLNNDIAQLICSNSLPSAIWVRTITKLSSQQRANSKHVVKLGKRVL